MEKGASVSQNLIYTYIGREVERFPSMQLPDRMSGLGQICTIYTFSTTSHTSAHPFMVLPQGLSPSITILTPFLGHILASTCDPQMHEHVQPRSNLTNTCIGVSSLIIAYLRRTLEKVCGVVLGSVGEQDAKR